MIDCAKPEESVSPFQPYTQATMLKHIGTIMEYAGTARTSLSLLDPIEELDASQQALMRWGMAIPWCWIVWDDERVLDHEIIECLVRRPRSTLKTLSHANYRE